MALPKNIYYQIDSPSLGDTLSATPVIRKLSKLYDNQIIVINNIVDLFKNNPYVKYTLPIDFFSQKMVESDDEYFRSFVLPGRQNQFGVERKFSSFDIRQIHANDLGFNLMPEEMECDFYPDDYDNPFDLPYKKYVVLHTAKNWPNRTWAKEKWQKIINYLAENKIYTVLIGKEVEEINSKHQVYKTFDKFENLYGQDLINKDNLSLCWHILNNASLFITMDTGPLHIAGTTDVDILQLSSAKDPRLSAPYRKGRQDYKYTHLKGPCDLYCTNNLKFSIKEWNSINFVPPLLGCLDERPNFDCHPSTDQVIKYLKNFFSNKLL